jgi:NhaP-type Na+/H+ or K+/H+ antiporter
MGETLSVTLLIVTAVMAGVSAQVLGSYLKIPSIVFLLIFGILLGPNGLNLIHPRLLGNGLNVVVSLSVALILFEGGLQLELRSLNRISHSLRNLITIGPLISLLGGSIAAHYLGEFPWPLAILYASLVIVTGPTVISPLLKQVRVDRQVSTLLESEGVLIDPIGAIIAVLVLDVILNGNPDPLQLFTGLLIRLVIGAGIGVVGGWLLSWFLKQAEFLNFGLKNLVVLAGLWDLYGLAQYVQDESGLMTAVTTGIVVGSASVPETRLLRRFKSQLTILAVSVLFILLAADLSLASLIALGWGSVLTVAALMLIVRPINVWLCTWNNSLNWRQKLFVSWIGPKGIVSASVASLFAILLTQRGVTGGEAVKALVFLTIIMTVFIQGLTAQGLANILQLKATDAKGAIIVGSNPLARLVAQLFQERGESVVLIDTDADACKQAEQENLRVFLSSAMNTRVLEEAGLDSMGTFLALTTNGEVNYVLAERAAEEFDPPRVLASYPDPDPGQASPPTRVHQAFTSDLPLKTWNQYLSNGEVKLVETRLEDQDFALQVTYLQALIESGKMIPLLIARQDQLRVARATEEWQPDDEIICLVQNPKPTLLQRLSGETIASRLNLEKLPRVRDVSLPSRAS